MAVSPIGGGNRSTRIKKNDLPQVTDKLHHMNPANGEVYSIQHYVIKFVSDLQQVGGFLQVLRFPPPIKLTVTIFSVNKTTFKLPVHVFLITIKGIMRAKLSNQQRKKRENQMIIALIHVSRSSYIIINIVSISISEV